MALGYRKHGAMAWRSPIASTLYLLLFFWDWGYWMRMPLGVECSNNGLSCECKREAQKKVGYSNFNK